ncbi:MAG: hypothetical protein H7Y02_00025 [Candidatus Obscuribacterales bacterium]|nr:hypothetical protein [Steroidobacteraceae bacterium]
MNHISRAAILIGLLALSACGKREPVPAPVNPDGVTGTTQTIAPTAEQLETESSLSTKRGIVLMTAETRRFRACNGPGELPLTDQTDGLLARVYDELGDKPLYVETFGDRDDSGNFVIEELLYATANNIQAACGAPLAKYELLARGNDPTWSVEVTQDAMVVKQSGAPTEIKFTSVDTADAEGTVTYRAGVDKHVLELTVTQQACRDASSGEYYGYAASAKLDKHTLTGCARLGE